MGAKDIKAWMNECEVTVRKTQTKGLVKLMSNEYLKNQMFFRARDRSIDGRRMSKRKKILYDVIFLQLQYNSIWYNYEHKRRRK
jgi:hypothetical protein